MNAYVTFLKLSILRTCKLIAKNRKAWLNHCSECFFTILPSTHVERNRIALNASDFYMVAVSLKWIETFGYALMIKR
jgi:hypothetical protein